MAKTTKIQPKDARIAPMEDISAEDLGGPVAHAAKMSDLESAKSTYTNHLDINEGYWNHRVLIGTPTTGLVRVEWMMARYGQIIPTNWASVDSMQTVPNYAPMKYLVADAQNLIVKAVIEKKIEWMVLIEQDNVLPPDTFIRFNQYMREKKVPMVSGLYFTKSVPPEPMIYRGVGNSFYHEWKLGDKVWASGVPTGCLIIHSSLLQVMWDESPEYNLNGQIVRRVFETPEHVWFDPEHGGFRTEVGTSDLTLCRRIMRDDVFTKAGWPEYAKMQYPFLVDTNIFSRHIDMDGRLWPLQLPGEYMPTEPMDSKLSKPKDYE